MNQRYPKLNEQWLPRDHTYNRVYTVHHYTKNNTTLACTHSNRPQYFYRDLTGRTVDTSHELDLTTYLRTL